MGNPFDFLSANTVALGGMEILTASTGAINLVMGNKRHEGLLSQRGLLESTAVRLGDGQ